VFEKLDVNLFELLRRNGFRCAGRGRRSLQRRPLALRIDLAFLLLRFLSPVRCPSLRLHDLRLPDPA
jgi:hypothetical protein